jgi:mannan endo-1,4-beta-mannosidase
MTTRRTLLASGIAATGLAVVPAGAQMLRARPFVTRRGQQLMLGDRRYRFVGGNLWYGPYLGADAPYGDRSRLGRELDRLKALGVTNLRILASSERSDLRGSITPTFRDASRNYNPTLLGGLDYLLAELGKRDMRAVLYLTNFWEWSGGMMAYLAYVNGGKFINMNDPAHPWPQFPNFNAAFYANRKAVGMYHDYVRAVVGRTNALTGTAYADDPTIMAWQLANEPRAAGDEPSALKSLPAFYAWIDGTARLIKSIAPRQLVSTGSEGLKGSVEREDILVGTHRFASIDYLTAHIWPLNWGWVKGEDLAGTYAEGETKVAEYITQHIAMARRLNKPLVIEEFGYPRDGESYDPAATTRHKDRFYGQIYTAAERDMAAKGPIAGTNFWAWNGEGRAQHPDARFRPGDRSYVGDPPHEPQGWYGMFDSDASTGRLVAAHAAAVAKMA